MAPFSVDFVRADCNRDVMLDIADAVAILGSLFSSPPTPIPPANCCGPDPTPDPLGCAIPGGGCP